MKSWAIEWEKAGHVVFPLRAGGKQPRVKWGDDSLCHTDYRAGDWAVRCDKLTVIDYDKGKKDYDEGWLPPHGGAGHEQATKNGVHRIFSYEDEVKRTADPAGARGVDIKTGSGSYIKIYGPPPSTLVALPASLKSVLSKKAARCNKLLRALSPDCARDKWLPVITAVRGLLGKDGLDVAYHWSKYSSGTNHQGEENYAEFVGRYMGLANWSQDDCWRILGGDFNLPTWTLKTYEDVEIKDAKVDFRRCATCGRNYPANWRARCGQDPCGVNYRRNPGSRETPELLPERNKFLLENRYFSGAQRTTMQLWSPRLYDTSAQKRLCIDPRERVLVWATRAV